MKIPIESSQKKSEYSVYVYGALDVRLFPNKLLNVDLKNIEIWVSHGLKDNSFNDIQVLTSHRNLLILSYVCCHVHSILNITVSSA